MLTPAETERIAKYTEELGESNQVIGKILLHGWTPFAEGIQYNNREDLEREVGDVLAAIELMIAGGDIRKDVIIERCMEKKKTITRYMEHQPRAVFLKLQ